MSLFGDTLDHLPPPKPSAPPLETGVVAHLLNQKSSAQSVINQIKAQKEPFQPQRFARIVPAHFWFRQRALFAFLAFFCHSRFACDADARGAFQPS